MHCERRTPCSSWYQSGNPSSALVVLALAATPPYPCPVSDTVAGEAGSSEAIRSVAVLSWTLVGSKATLMAQVEPTATGWPVHASATTANSPGSAPFRLTCETASGEVPELLTSTVRSELRTPTRWSPKATDVGVGSALEAASAFVLMQAGTTENGERTPSWGMLSDPVRTPATEGANATSRVQLASRATLVPAQPSETIRKSPASGPPSVAALGVISFWARLVTVTRRVPETPAVGWPPKSTLPGEVVSGPASLPDTVNRFVVSGFERLGPVRRT